MIPPLISLAVAGVCSLLLSSCITAARRQCRLEFCCEVGVNKPQARLDVACLGTKTLKLVPVSLGCVAVVVVLVLHLTG